MDEVNSCEDSQSDDNCEINEDSKESGKSNRNVTECARHIDAFSTQKAATKSFDSDSDGGGAGKLSGKDRRRLEKLQKSTKGNNYYSTANVKNRNAEKKGKIDPVVAFRGHSKKVPGKRKK